jgi:hypothetical protein
MGFGQAKPKTKTDWTDIYWSRVDLGHQEVGSGSPWVGDQVDWM